MIFDNIMKKKALLNERENHAANEPYTFTETRTLK
jgi:hypothetical protein